MPSQIPPGHVGGSKICWQEARPAGCSQNSPCSNLDCDDGSSYHVCCTVYAPSPTPCPGVWGEWGACNNSCGDGTQDRVCSCAGGCSSYSGCNDPSGSCSSVGSQACCVCDSGCTCSGSADYHDACSAPYCGQHVCDSDSGSRCAGSSCSTGCTDTDCGDCSDRRNSSWISPSNDSSHTHDYPITISGTATDTNGSTTGVSAVHVYRDGDPGTGTFIASIPVNESTGAFSGAIDADFYVSAFTGSEAHTLNLWAIKRDSNDCDNWKIGQRTINVINSAPQNDSFSPLDDAIQSAVDATGSPIVEFTAEFSDINPQTGVTSGQREHGIRDARVRFGEAGSYVALLTYLDEDDGGTPSVVFQDNGSGIIVDGSVSWGRIDGGTLSLTFSLDFSSFDASLSDTYSIWMYSQDWADVVATWENMGDLEIWNGTDVPVDGYVYNVTLTYPDTSCAIFSSAPEMSGVNLSFEDGINPPLTAETDGSGHYTINLIYGNSYTYTLSPTVGNYFNYLNALNEVDPTLGVCEAGESIPFTVRVPGSDNPQADFGMAEIQDPWLQVIGGDLTSYSSISNIVPFTCENDYDLGGSCLPFTALDSTSFDENGILVAQSSLSLGSSLAAGDPNDWQVVDSELHQTTGQGFNYFRQELESLLSAEDDVFDESKNLSEIPGIDDGVVANGEEEIKIIDGDLTIDQDITVANGGLLLLLVSGGISIDGSVENVQGILITNGTIQINNDPSGEGEQINLEGTFISDAEGDGAGSIANQRSLEGSDGSVGDLSNNTAPAAVFTFRPDLIITLLNSDARTALGTTLDWEEIEP